MQWGFFPLQFDSWQIGFEKHVSRSSISINRDGEIISDGQLNRQRLQSFLCMGLQNSVYWIANECGWVLCFHVCIFYNDLSKYFLSRFDAPHEMSQIDNKASCVKYSDEVSVDWLFAIIIYSSGVETWIYCDNCADIMAANIPVPCVVVPSAVMEVAGPSVRLGSITIVMVCQCISAFSKNEACRS